VNLPHKFKTNLSQDQIFNVANDLCPKSIVARDLDWKVSLDESQLALAGYRSDIVVFLAILFTGVLPGILIWKLMGRTQKVIVDMSELSQAGLLTVQVRGGRAKKLAEELIHKMKSE